MSLQKLRVCVCLQRRTPPLPNENAHSLFLALIIFEKIVYLTSKTLLISDECIFYHRVCLFLLLVFSFVMDFLIVSGFSDVINITNFLLDSSRTVVHDIYFVKYFGFMTRRLKNVIFFNYMFHSFSSISSLAVQYRKEISSGMQNVLKKEEGRASRRVWQFHR